ncbi:type 1 glutamine amidotransferase [Rhodobaculum claviforme]|uniref:Glutamine amidotransferase n=1 Tax=Rhodobaculum claviforme TaxID=1549854 RepID=A0A934WHU3_9RHOB|nr:type 1 glutamine amidotransferase [Rhodobaculum claviforme]MBK5926072.1 glutamine amidotransferase [Rhodobaculum claviforme]
MRIGILETGLAPDDLRARHGSYPDLFTRLLGRHGFDFTTHRVVEMEFPDSVHDAEGWLITGSRHGVYEDHPFIPPLEALIRQAVAEAVPVVGICFGHQIIARALGGRVEKFPGGWAVGPQDYDFDGTPLRLNAWHQDQVIDPPEGAEVIATHPFCPYAGLRYGDRAFSVQAHPEFPDDFVAGLIETRGRGVVPDDRLDAALERLGGPGDSGVLADRIANFFRQPRRSAA